MYLSVVDGFRAITIIILIETQIILSLADGNLFTLIPESFFFFFGIILVAFSFLLSYDNMFQLHLVHFLPQAFDQKILCKSLDVFYGEMRVELGMSILMGGSLFIDLSRGHSYEIYLCIFKDKIPCEFILITSN